MTANRLKTSGSNRKKKSMYSKTKLLPNKAVLAKEIKRRSPRSALNEKNKTIKELALLLANAPPLTEQRDISFVRSEEKKFRLVLTNLLEDDDEVGATPGRLQDTDRPRSR